MTGCHNAKTDRLRSLGFACFVLAMPTFAKAQARAQTAIAIEYNGFPSTLYVWPTLEGVDRCAAPCTLHVDDATVGWATIGKRQVPFTIPADAKSITLIPHEKREGYLPSGIILVSLGAAAVLTSIGFMAAAGTYQPQWGGDLKVVELLLEGLIPLALSPFLVVPGVLFLMNHKALQTHVRR